METIRIKHLPMINPIPQIVDVHYYQERRWCE